jgi:hypothetical protein
MIVSPTRIESSPESTGRIRYSATIEYDEANVAPEELWFEFPEAFAGDLVPSGNPWLTALFPLAARLGGRLKIADPVDPVLLEGAFENFRIWHGWDNAFHIPSIEAPLRTSDGREAGTRVGTFFSGGVDSFFSLLDNDAHPHYMRPVDDIITIWGFDIPLNRPDQIAIASEQLDCVAAELGKTRVEAWTNLRHTRLKELDWGRHVHGSAVLSVGQCLETRYSRLLLPSSYSTRHMHPWGSHAVVDPNFSTSTMRIRYAGGPFGRMEKIAFIKDSPVVHKYVRVCWQGGGAENCSVCEKCVRTMAAFAGYNVLSKCTAFDVTQFSLDRLRAAQTYDEHNIQDFAILLECMPATAAPELRAALAECIQSNRRRYARIHTFEKLEMTPLIGWLFGHYKRRFVTQKRRSS